MQLFLLRLGVICVLPSLLILDTLSRLAGLARFQIASCIFGGMENGLYVDLFTGISVGDQWQ
jgi:hypothetical protein